ncbi:unnamed protein product [Fraxinus pennsylvanica]|uniref:AIPP2-like SPOC-like domain-containing protein n=1 Tax=Fraxinus pennsylvanica TaxID=56036 RepID=A0AAD1Z7T4_9LAMI|nr:unnamed protein product [Fraxinus pennsylvanica]
MTLLLALSAKFAIGKGTVLSLVSTGPSPTFSRPSSSSFSSPAPPSTTHAASLPVNQPPAHSMVTRSWAGAVQPRQFTDGTIRYERIFDHLVEEMMSQELAMKAILSNAELLVFTSLELPSQCWRFQGKYYLWGVFRGKQVHAHIVDNHLTDSIGGDKPVLYSDCSKHMDISGGKNTMKTKNWDARSPLSPLSDNGNYGLATFL